MADELFTFKTFKLKHALVALYRLTFIFWMKNNKFTRLARKNLLHTGRDEMNALARCSRIDRSETPMCEIALPSVVVNVHLETLARPGLAFISSKFFSAFLIRVHATRTKFDKGIRQTHLNRKFNSPWRSICLDSAAKCWLTCSWVKQCVRDTSRNELPTHQSGNGQVEKMKEKRMAKVTSIDQWAAAMDGA